MTRNWLLVAGCLLFAAQTAVAQSSDDLSGNPSISSSVQNAYLPGLSGTYFATLETSKTYFGANFHYAFIQGISATKQSMNFGGYYESYLEFGFFKEQNSKFNDDIFFTYLIGINVSFEKFLTRNRCFLIPYFGGKFGGLYLNKAGNGVLLEPLLGMVIYQTEFVTLNYDAGLFLNTANLNEYIGLRHSLVLNFNL